MSSVPWLSATAMRNLLKMSPPSGLDLQVRTETIKPMETRLPYFLMFRRISAMGTTVQALKPRTRSSSFFMARYQGWVVQNPGRAMAALTLAGGIALGSVPEGGGPAGAGPAGKGAGSSAAAEAKAEKMTAEGGMWCSRPKGRNSGSRTTPA